MKITPVQKAFLQEVRKRSGPDGFALWSDIKASVGEASAIQIWTGLPTSLFRRDGEMHKVGLSPLGLHYAG